MEIKIWSIMSVPLRLGYLRPWRNLTAIESVVSRIESNNSDFKVNLNVEKFKPEELKVKVVDDYLTVDGKHEERTDEHGFISRQFTRRYKLPDNIDKSALSSHLSSDGVLTFTAPKLALSENEYREIPITQTNAPANEDKESNKKEDNIEV